MNIAGATVFFCPVCLGDTATRMPGQGLVCDGCGSLQRHRVMLLMALLLIRAPSNPGAVVDLSPLTAMQDALREDARKDYVSVDVDPTSQVSVIADLCHLPLSDASVRFIHCSHILEHVADDTSAMAEMRRVLAPGGEVLIQVPRRRGAPTEEALGVPAEELERRFGQADHVRLFGDDLEDRLRRAGLGVHTTSYRRVLPPSVLSVIGVESDHELWVAGDDPESSSALDESRLVGVLAERMLAVRSSLKTAMAEADEWKSRYEWLARRPSVRAGRWLKRGLRRVTGAS